MIYKYIHKYTNKTNLCLNISQKDSIQSNIYIIVYLFHKKTNRGGKDGNYTTNKKKN